LRAEAGYLKRGCGKRNDARSVSSSTIVELGYFDVFLDGEDDVFVVFGPLDMVYGARKPLDIEAITFISNRLHFPFSGEHGEDFPVGPEKEFFAVIGKLKSRGIGGEFLEPFAFLAFVVEEKIAGFSVYRGDAGLVIGDQRERCREISIEIFRWSGGYLGFSIWVSCGK